MGVQCEGNQTMAAVAGILGEAGWDQRGQQQADGRASDIRSHGNLVPLRNSGECSYV